MSQIDIKYTVRCSNSFMIAYLNKHYKIITLKKAQYYKCGVMLRMV